jgi:signal peptidase I
MWGLPSLIETKQRALLRGILATIPFLMYVRDEYFSFMYVRGTSMEPTIHDGDILLVRKRDGGSLLLRLLNWKPSWSRQDAVDKNEIVPARNFQVQKQKLTAVSDENCTDRVKTMWYRMEDDDSYLWVSPAHASPLVLPGHVIVYRNPYHFPESLVKRVVAVGGQRLSTVDPRLTPFYDDNDDDNSEIQKLGSAPYSMSDFLYQKRHFQLEHRFRYNVQIPPHFLYTEGDNPETSIHDSRDMDHKPISQNLVVGIAEYLIWPPTRWQRLHRQTDSTSQDRRVIWEK